MTVKCVQLALVRGNSWPICAPYWHGVTLNVLQFLGTISHTGCSRKCSCICPPLRPFSHYLHMWHWSIAEHASLVRLAPMLTGYSNHTARRSSAAKIQTIVGTLLSWCNDNNKYSLHRLNEHFFKTYTICGAAVCYKTQSKKLEKQQDAQGVHTGSSCSVLQFTTRTAESKADTDWVNNIAWKF